MVGSSRIVDVDAVAIHQLIKQLLEPHKLLAQKGFAAPTFSAPAPAAPMPVPAAPGAQSKRQKKLPKAVAAGPVDATATAPTPAFAPAAVAGAPTQDTPVDKPAATTRSFVPGAGKRTEPKPATPVAQAPTPVAPAQADDDAESTVPADLLQAAAQAELAAALVI
jgi:hypothetical protein